MNEKIAIIIKTVINKDNLRVIHIKKNIVKIINNISKKSLKSIFKFKLSYHFSNLFRFFRFLYKSVCPIFFLKIKSRVLFFFSI